MAICVSDHFDFNDVMFTFSQKEDNQGMDLFRAIFKNTDSEESSSDEEPMDSKDSTEPTASVTRDSTVPKIAVNNSLLNQDGENRKQTTEKSTEQTISMTVGNIEGKSWA